MKWRVILVSMLLVSCGEKDESVSSVASTSGSVANLMVCDVAGGFKTNCRLRSADQIVIPSPKILADINVRYSFSCRADGMPNTIKLYTSDNRNVRELETNSVNKVALLQSSVDIRLKDWNPAETRSWVFQASSPCDLSLSWTITPSTTQISTWAERTKSIVDVLEANIAAFELQGMIKTWYEAFISTPDATGGIIRGRIDNLKAKPTLTLAEKQELISLEKVISNAPEAEIFAGFEQYRQNVRTNRVDAVKHRDLLKSWGRPIDNALKLIIDKSNSF